MFTKFYTSTDKRCFGVAIYDLNTNNFRIRFYNGYNNGASWETKEHDYTSLAINTWYHLAWAHDGVNKTLTCQLRNAAGDTLGTDFDESAWGQETNVEDAAVNIGALGGSFHYAGKIDECVIFKDLLTTSEMDDIRTGDYSAGATSIEPAPTRVFIWISKLLDPYLAAVGFPVVGCIRNPSLTRRKLWNPLNWLK